MTSPTRPHRLIVWVWGLGGACLLLLAWPVLACALHNWGMLGLLHGLVGPEPTYQGADGLYAAAAGSSWVERATPRLESAAALLPESAVLRWGYARALLAVGRAGEAHRALRPLTDAGSVGQLVFLDALAAAHYAQDWEALIVLYERWGQPEEPFVPSLASVVAHAYLEEALTLQGSDRPALLQKAYLLEPSGIALNYAMWQSAPPSSEAREQSLGRLVRFPAAAIDLDDPLQLQTLIVTVPELYRSVIWDRGRLLSAVSALVWKHSELLELETLLLQLAETEPLERAWAHLLGELYLRRGEPAAAVSVYEALLARSAQDDQARLGLAMALERLALESTAPETQRERLRTAAAQYKAYRQRRPGDLLVYRRLADLYARLDDPAQAQMLSELTRRTDAQQIIADLLGVERQEITLGPNLVEDGDFQSLGTGSSEIWQWSVAAGREPWADGAFVGGADHLFLPSVRIWGLWISEPIEGQEPARAGVWDELDLPLAGLYWMSFWYRSDAGSGNTVDIWVVSNDQARYSYPLCPTDKEWHYAAMLLEAQPTDPLVILVRNWGTALFQLADLRLMSVGVAEPLAPEVFLPAFYPKAMP